MDRLTFNLGSSRGGPLVVSGRHQRAGARRAPASNAVTAAVAAIRERYDWDYLWMLLFTALLFFRPQDQIPGLEILHLSELTAIAGLAAMAVRRMSAGLTIAHVNVEVIAIVILGAIIVLTVPFSIWPGGSAHVFTDIYVKIILIFALMMSTITSPRRLRQMTWVMMVASGYIGARAVFDYVRGVNLVEGDRVRGAVGGMFENPNDLALNLVTFLAPTLIVILHERKPSRRIFACGLAVAMLAAIVCTKSRSGFLGLLATGLVVMYYTVRVNPAAVGAVVVAGLMALPAMPSSFWDRMDSIMNAEEDQTGSRAARLRLIDQGIQVFLENPITGIGAGQFKNYNSPDEVEKWRVTHNVWLQVAAELGIGGLLTFAYLVCRGFSANFAAMRIMRHSRKRAGPTSSRPAESDLRLTDEEWRTLDLNAKGMLAAMVGWTVCSLFASVAFNWTFYYVLALSVAGREMLAARRAAVRAAEEAAPIKAAPRSRLIRVHA
ncbi:MAG TPA: O-antigen ligase family protein [Vicinamibacterales bacterium]|nr:O-antigen ligase family protein [Vicinamibacterales bacterium]